MKKDGITIENNLVVPPDMKELADWWKDTSHDDLAGCLDKTAEYGARDLEVMGAAMAGAEGSLGIEEAIAFYVLGKAARLTQAYREGREPDIDSWVDLTVYSMMARRVRESGGWPNG